MALYNYFGVTVANIVTYYVGSELTDYATNSLTGTQVIQSELDYAEAEIVARLSQKTLNALENIKYMKLSEAVTTFPSGFTLSNATLYETNKGTSTSSYTSLGCSSQGCSNLNIELTRSSSTVTISGGYVATISPFDTNKDYYISADLTVSSLPSLGYIIREIVACRLGKQLYSRGNKESDWSAVEAACSKADLALSKIDEYYLPAEFKKFSYFPGYEIQSSRNSIKTYTLKRG